MNNEVYIDKKALKKLFFRIKRRLFYELKNIILRVNFFLFNKFIKKYSYRLEDYDEDLNVFKPGNPKFFKNNINFYKGDGNIMPGNGGNLFGGADFILIGQYQTG